MTKVAIAQLNTNQIQNAKVIKKAIVSSLKPNKNLGEEKLLFPNLCLPTEKHKLKPFIQ